ncbi:MAG: NAD(P)/FAD-dependent oxidoreductase [Geobacteraceae bacterium]|nr:NAD(P)/FAD-dependent oxidoreductase [Geobacteraceae bacterium]
MKEKTVIIIGAGIAGLAAGCYAQMNGFSTRIFEMDTRPGGLCTSWQRSGYNINGGVHTLLGCAEQSAFFQIWQELGALQGRRFETYEDFICFEGTDGRFVTLYSDIDKLEEHLLALAPEDSALIREFIKGVRRCLGFNPPIIKAPELYGPIEGLRILFNLLPHLMTFRKWFPVSMRDFSTRFKSILLREMFAELWFPETPLYFFMMSLAMMHQKISGYPLGGSFEFSRSIEQRYLGLGGECNYGATVSRILVEDGLAVGIKLEDGTEHRADYVVSAADGHTTIFKMLEGRFLNKKIRSFYGGKPIFPPLIYISLGLKQPFDLALGSSTGLNFPLKEPLIIAGEKITRMGIRVSSFDPGSAPSGKTLVKVLFPSNMTYWEPFSKDEQQYRAQKEQIIDQVVSIMDQRFPGFGDLIEMRDMATPLTYVRYTGNWQGSHQGWMITPQTGLLRAMNRLPHLKNFFMAGHWALPGGGVPSAALSARNVVQLLCKQNRIDFVTTVP